MKRFIILALSIVFSSIANASGVLHQIGGQWVQAEEQSDELERVQADEQNRECEQEIEPEPELEQADDQVK